VINTAVFQTVVINTAVFQTVVINTAVINTAVFDMFSGSFGMEAQHPTDSVAGCASFPDARHYLSRGH